MARVLYSTPADFMEYTNRSHYHSPNHFSAVTKAHFVITGIPIIIIASTSVIIQVSCDHLHLPSVPKQP